MEDLVWYASYGSNLLYDRFMCYIKGGTPEGSSTRCEGCSDKTPPQDRRPITIPHELYFAENSSSWEDKGVAFVKSERDLNAQTLGRMYLITREQFVQIVRQENGRSPDNPRISIDFEETIAQGQSMIKGGWYSRVIYLSEEDGYPIFTFTGRWEDDAIPPNKPCEAYRKTIIRGLRETYLEMGDEERIDYLGNAGGIFAK